MLREHGFEDFVEQLCAGFYAPKQGRPSIAPGVYFWMLLIGYFEGELTQSEGLRGAALIHWHCGSFWASSWTRVHRITRVFHERGAAWM